mgnify:CR=1 FL=1
MPSLLYARRLLVRTSVLWLCTWSVSTFLATLWPNSTRTKVFCTSAHGDLIVGLITLAISGVYLHLTGEWMFHRSLGVHTGFLLLLLVSSLVFGLALLMVLLPAC